MTGLVAPPPLLACWWEDWDNDTNWIDEVSCYGNAPEDDHDEWPNDDFNDDSIDDYYEQEEYTDSPLTDDSHDLFTDDEECPPQVYKNNNLVNPQTFNDVGYDIQKDCLLCAQKILDNYKNTKGNYGDSDHVYQLIIKDNGKLMNSQDATRINDAKNCIDRHLNDNRPIIVGVSYDINKAGNEGVTNHFIVITGSGHDESGDYYTYVETGRYHARESEATDSRENRLCYDTSNDRWIDEDSNGSRHYQYTMTQVRPNDGNTTNTTKQGTK